MKNGPLVSVVTPCYNMENKIRKFLDSLLFQTYKNLEIILVNDGSKDNTENVIKEYIPKLETLGMSVKYIYRENGGAARAIKTGLDYVSGKYLIWPDADDVLTEDSVEQKVKFLEENPKYAWVRTNAYVLNSDNLDDKSQLIVNHKNIKRQNVYKEFIYFKTYYCSGSYMVRWEDFLKVNPNKYIYETYYGQNIQMLLPMAKNYKCGYIDLPLYGYIIYSDSHSRLGGAQTYKKAIDYSQNIEKITIATMEFISAKPREIKKVKNDFCVRRLFKAYRANEREDAKKEYKNISGIKRLNPILFVISRSRKNKLADFLCRIYELSDIFFFRLTNRR